MQSSHDQLRYFVGSGVPGIQALVPVNTTFPASAIWNLGTGLVVQDVHVETPIDILNQNIVHLTTAVENLTERVEMLEQKIESFMSQQTDIRNIPDEQAKNEMKELFELMHGQVIFPSEIAEELHLEYDTVVRLLADLEHEGKIRSVESSF